MAVGRNTDYSGGMRNYKVTVNGKSWGGVEHGKVESIQKMKSLEYHSKQRGQGGESKPGFAEHSKHQPKTLKEWDVTFSDQEHLSTSCTGWKPILECGTSRGGQGQGQTASMYF
jgi:hypothetical protein